MVGGQASSIVYDDVGLEFSYHFEEVFGVPVLRLTAESVEPDDIDFAVVGADFAKLAVEEFDIFVVGVGAVVGVVPVNGGVIVAELKTGLVAGIGQLLYDVAFEGRVGDFVFCQLAVEHREAIVMFRGEDQIFHAGVFCDSDPFVGVEFDGIEPLVEIVVFFGGDRAGSAATSALPPAGPAYLRTLEADGAPVDEQAEF